VFALDLLLDGASAGGIDEAFVLRFQQFVQPLFGKIRDVYVIGVRGGELAEAAPFEKNLGLEEFIELPRFALDVIDGVAVLYVRIEAEDHVSPEPVCGSKPRAAHFKARRQTQFYCRRLT